MKLKHLISICILLLLGACSDKESTNDIELEMKFVSNIPLINYQLSSEEVLQLVNIDSENYKSVDLSKIKVDGATLLDQENTLTLDFSNQEGRLAKYRTEGYDLTAYEYPITVHFEGVPANESAKTDYKLVNLAAIDYYNGSFLQETALVDDPNMAAAIYLQKLFEAKQVAWDKELILDGITEIENPIKDNPYEIAKSGFTWISKEYEYDKEKAKSIKDSLTYAETKGLEDFVQNRKGICFDFAYLYKLYLDTYNIENRLAYGNFEGVPKKINHVWNEIKINDEWIPLDTTGNGFGEEGKYENYVSVYTTNL